MADTQSNATPPAPVVHDSTPCSGVLHVRRRHTENFTVIGNHLAQHNGLSALAIGLCVYILSLPDGAPVTVKALTARFPEGEITIRRALNELVATGYLERRRFLIGGGRFASRTIADAGRPAPLLTCDGCDRAFRTHDPTARCADCRPVPAGPRTERAA
jgi:hypothetical protein